MRRCRSPPARWMLSDSRPLRHDDGVTVSRHGMARTAHLDRRRDDDAGEVPEQESERLRPYRDLVEHAYEHDADDRSPAERKCTMQTGRVTGHQGIAEDHWKQA